MLIEVGAKLSRLLHIRLPKERMPTETPGLAMKVQILHDDQGFRQLCYNEPGSPHVAHDISSPRIGEPSPK